MQILYAPNPVLRQQCEDVAIADEPDLERTMRQMAELMYDAYGCGLAAPQVGISKKMVVVDCDWSDEEGSRNPIFLINPTVESTSGELVVADEGCLSIPGITIPVERREEAVVKAYDFDGKEFTIEANGFLARCLQHEIDHLSGITLFEKLNVVDRLDKLEEYKAALAEIEGGM